uniref:ORF7a protein n=1 Tax=Bat Coronavirus RsGD17 TaxID=3018903 RepID=A0AA49I9A4_9NIDO|nr:ORF7a protein [Bat Coronavirus RsGD17]
MQFLIVALFFYFQCFLWAIKPIREACIGHFPYCIYEPSTLSYFYSALGFILIVISLVTDAVFELIDYVAHKFLLVCRFLN